MKIIKNLKEMRSLSKKILSRGKTIGFVPTMGCLHPGHLSLVSTSKKMADISVVSIFINPLQFGPGEDLARYPKSFKKDAALLRRARVDYLFFPDAKDMFPADFSTFVDLIDLPERLCGKTRPGHFRGVATVLAKLLNLVSPTYVFLGEKDYQQQLIIKQMAKDLSFPSEIISLPTIREDDGLAMSSRNRYLNAKERKAAAALYRALSSARQAASQGEKNAGRLIARMRGIIRKEPLIKIDYLAVVDPSTLKPVKHVRAGALVAVAAHIGKARLIDNIAIGAK